MHRVLVPRSGRTGGFTLIELLVVVSIIAILAAILFPVFARARENARRTACLSNMKQINLGMMQYVQDNDEYYPNYTWNDGVAPGPEYGGEWYPSSGSTTWFWMNMIYPYVKSVQVFICPSSSNAHAKYTAPSGQYGPYERHYGINASTGFIPTGRWGAPGPKMTVVQAPAKTYLFGEASQYVVSWDLADGPSYTNSNSYLPGACPFFPSSTVTLDDCWKGRHFGGMNIGFADGHVKWLKAETLVAEALKTDHGGWNPANS